MTDNLMPCPFCGSRLQWVDGPDNGLRMYLHSENGCAIEGQIFIVDHSDASKARLASWNSRAPSEGKEAVAWRIRHMNDGPHMWEYYPLSVVASPSENTISQHLTVRQLLDILNDDKHASAQERNPEPHAPSYLMQAFRDAWIMAGEMEGGWEDAYRLWRPPFAVDSSPQTKKQGWQDMNSAPLDGKHCILAIRSGPFVYSIQGAYMQGEWHNAANIKAEPLAWMPNVMLPKEFLPWTDEFKARAATMKGQDNGR